MAKVMMEEGNVSHTFQGEETQITFYLEKRTQLGPNNDKIPYDLWKGRPTLVKYFKVSRVNFKSM